ncbi:MAG: NAD(P)/FAD-dependent oxidoreductase, partial [Mycobacterium sp.]
VNDDVNIEATGDELFDYPALCVRRVTLDALLVQAAGAAGAEVRTGSRVTGLISDDGRVTGVQTDQGPIHARLVVGADGRHSTVASAVGAREYHVSPPGRMAAWGYFEGVVDRDGCARFGRMGDVGFLAGPTDGDLYMAAVAPDLTKQHEFHADRDAYFTAAIRKWPDLADVLAGGRRVGPLRVVTKWHGYFRESAGPGWVLVGDAGHFKDFTPGQGISDALRQSERLVQAIENALGTTNLDAAMQQWWRWRDDDAYEMYWFASVMGKPGASSPLTTRLLRDISADAHATRSFLRVLNHELRPSQLFTPAMLARGTARALRDQPRHIVATLKEVVASGKQNMRQARQKRMRPPGMPTAT